MQAHFAVRIRAELERRRRSRGERGVADEESNPHELAEELS